MGFIMEVTILCKNLANMDLEPPGNSLSDGNQRVFSDEISW